MWTGAAALVSLPSLFGYLDTSPLDDAAVREHVFARFGHDIAHLLSTRGGLPGADFDATTRTILGDGSPCAAVVNIWHALLRVAPEKRGPVLEEYLVPPDLNTACWFGRLDVVRRRLEAGDAPDGDDPAATPLHAAIGAHVVTDLHVAIVEALIDAGATVGSTHIDTLSADAVGSAADAAILTLLEKAALRSGDPSLE